MPPDYLPLRWESTGQKWWYASPIDWAAANGHYDLVRELLHLDTNLLIKLTSLRRLRRLETVWDDAAQFSEAAKFRSQVARKLLIECQTSSGHNSLLGAGYGGWLLYTAASAADEGFVKELLDRDPFLVFGEGEYGITDMLYAAARSKNSEVFRVLLDFSEWQGGEIGSGFGWEMKNRAVHAAARGGNMEILRELLGDSSASVLVYRDAKGSSVLHTASGRGQVEVVKDLLASYDIITATDNQGNTALNVAAYRGHLAVVEVLVMASPSVALITNNYGDTFLHMAVAGFQSPGFRLLDQQFELVKQLVCGNFVSMDDFINVRNNDGRTALHMAVVENVMSDLVELLMTVPSINLNIRDAGGMTPLDLLKQRPQSASSEVLIKRLISAGGIANSQDYATRSALVSHLKMRGTGVSPGTSFQIRDSEIFLFTGMGNAYNATCNRASTEYSTCSSELNSLNSPAASNSLDGRKSGTVSYAAKQLKILLKWPRKGRKAGEDDSSESFRSGNWEDSPTPLRQRYSKKLSLPNNKRILCDRNSFPSPSTKKKFSATLMHGVIQAGPKLVVQSQSSSFSESSDSSTVPVDKQKGTGMENKIEESSGSNHSFNGEKFRINHKQNSFSKRLMNKYLCFGAQSLSMEDSVSCSQSHWSFKRSSLVA
ncbi:uncharacterized protein LOC127797960 [Diospyros lotus]|uniref:uncharacterized protein LOC127797960 n=1 Tax=Diospyros lotus TaxID=55363 RepID=UPI00225ABA1D|nr:uncharacterized protein LOC127797960 [Diospyros lotus]